MPDNQQRTNIIRSNKFTVLAVIFLALSLAFLISVINKNDGIMAKVEAASACPTSPYGTSTVSVNIPVAGTYNVWSRLQVPAANNSFYLKIDSTCYKVTGANIPVNQWRWIGFENGSSSSMIKQTLQAGTHGVSIISNEPTSVRVDRIILTTGACEPLPEGNGNDCMVPIDSPPTVTLDSPANGAQITGVTRTASTAVDDTKISKVDFYIDSSTTPFKSITAAPYSFDWDPRSLPNGQHKISAKAFDSAGQTATASANVDIQITPPPPPPVAGAVFIAVPANNDTVTGKDVILSAGISNLPNVSKVEFYLDDSLNLGAAAPTIYGWLYNWDSTLVSNGAHKLTAKATVDTTVTTSPAITTTVSNSGDSVPPSVPGNLRLDKAPSRDQARIIWNASTDNSGGSIRYFTYLDDEFKNRQRDTVKTFYNLQRGTSYVAKIVAVDDIGNQSAPAILTFRTKSFCISAGVCVW